MQCFGCFNHRPTRRPDVQSERDARLVHHETENSAYERLVVRLNAETATLIGEDGLQTDVPQNVLQRSEHLCNALNNILTENATKESSIVLPSGVLQGWLGSLRELAILQDDASATVAATAPGTFLEQSAWYLKAADFLNDEDCLQQLFGRVSRVLFPASGAQDSQSHVAKKLRELPQGLLMKALLACKQPMHRCLTVLPEELHLGALHAFYPSIAASDSISVQQLQSQEHLNALGAVLGSVHRLKSLSVSGTSTRHPYSADSLILQILPLVKLQKLCLSHLSVTQKGEAALSRLFKCLSDLQELTINHACPYNPIKASNVPAFLSSISCLKALTSLELRGNHVDDRAARTLAKICARLLKLHRLCLAENSIKFHGFRALTSRLLPLKHFEDLSVPDNSVLSDYTSKHLIIPQFPRLLHLDVSRIGSRVDRVDYSGLPRAIQRLTTLQSLNLYGNKVLMASMMHSIEPLLQLRTLMLSSGVQCVVAADLMVCISKLQGLRHLDVAFNKLFSSDVSALNSMHCISCLQQLTRLRLAQCSPVTGLGVALRGIQGCHRLQSLDLTGHVFSESEVESIAEAVCGIPSLRSLNTSACNLFTDAVCSFDQCMLLQGLETLDVGYISWPQADPRFFAHFSSMTALKSLQLCRTSFPSGDSLAHMLSGLVALSFLSFLGLRSCKLRDRDTKVLAPVLQKLDSLREVNLVENYLSNEGWAAVVGVLHREPELVCLHVDQSFSVSHLQPLHHLHVTLNIPV